MIKLVVHIHVFFPILSPPTKLTVQGLIAEVACQHFEISERGDDGRHVAQHAAHAQQQQHGEVEHRPELGRWHVLYSLAVHYKGQACALNSLEQEIGETDTGQLRPFSMQVCMCQH